MTLLEELALITLAAVGIAVCLALLPDAKSRRWRGAALPRPSRPEQLARLEGLVMMAQASALQVHAYLRPLLAEIASRRLAARGQTLAGMPVAVGSKVLGDQLWEIVRPDRPFPEDRHGPGISSEELAAMLDVLERL